MHLIHVYGKKYERGSNWSEPEVLELLQIWSDLPVQTELVTCLRNQHVFNRIANILRQKGINRTGDQCREKIKKLKLEYKQKSLRCERYYQLMERAHGHRCAATSGSLPLWTQPPAGQQLLEVKTEVMSSDEDGAAEVQYEFGAAAEEHQAAAETQGSARDLCSTSDCSEPNTSGFSGGPVSSATAPVSLKDEGIHGDREGEGESRPYHQKKRRRRGSGGQLSSALSDYLSWQRAAEERLLALEEARLRQEARAEERWERREERRAQLDRQHELRLLSMLTQVLSPSRDVPANHTPGSHESPSSLGSAPPPRYNPLLSERGNAVRMHQGILQEGYAQYHADKHHEEDNPHGIINLGTSENKLCYDLLQKRLTRPDMLELRPELLHYPDWRGHPMLREEVARFLSDYCRAPAPLSAQNVVVMNGCGSLFSALAAAICDPEDVFLIPSPFYGVITEDVGLYSGVRLHHVPLHPQLTGSDVRPFQLTVEKLEKALTEARQEGSRVKGLVLINPHNPLGDVFSSRHISSFLHFAKKHHLHVIVDEIYMLSVFDQEFSSVLSLDELPDPQRTHVMWGVSKDLAMAGMRVGVLYSENRDLLEVLDRLGNFHGIPGPSQHQIATLLRDRDWLNGEFLPENRRRLREAHHFLSEELKKLEVPFLQRGAGFFIWADFSKYMRRKTSDEELRMWRCFLKHKLLLSCGQAFSCSSPGWFRIIFTQHNSKLKLGVHRLRSALQELQQDRHDWPRDSAPLTPSDPASSENPPLSNGQSAGSASSLDGLIGALRQQLHSCDWLERNRPDLSPGDDPQRLETFTHLLDRARRC